jgi:hypothetical protein
MPADLATSGALARRAKIPTWQLILSLTPRGRGVWIGKSGARQSHTNVKSAVVSIHGLALCDRDGD